MANDIARVPLERRLGDARDGNVSTVLAERILAELSLLPVSGVCAAHPGSAGRLERMTENAVMDRINPAVTGEWGLERTCYASVAWYTETAFRALEATGNPDSRRILARVTEKATKSLADAFGHLATELTCHDIVDPYLRDHLPDCVTSHAEWVERHGSDMALKALRWRERGLGEKCLPAGFLCLPIESLGNAAGQLIASSPKAGPSAPDRLASLMGRLLELVQEVHTLTSQTGFEALLRGCRVVTYGGPFYAGWGLTTDRSSFPRRKAIASVDVLVAAVLLCYPAYYDWEHRCFTDCMAFLAKLKSHIQPPKV